MTPRKKKNEPLDFRAAGIAAILTFLIVVGYTSVIRSIVDYLIPPEPHVEAPYVQRYVANGWSCIDGKNCRIVEKEYGIIVNGYMYPLTCTPKMPKRVPTSFSN